MIGNTEYQKNEEENSKDVEDASVDEFIRYYNSMQEMTTHLVAKQPVSVGLIKERALWYRLPYLPNQFFVLGESHAGVTGIMIKTASNIQKPILYESASGWSVKEFEERLLNPTQTVAGIDEHSSKLYRALEVWDPRSLISIPTANITQEIIPTIPKGQQRTRDKQRGSYRLVIRNNEGNSEWWRPKNEEVPVNTYNTNNQAYLAIMSLFKPAFGDETKMMKARYGSNFWKAYLLLRDYGWKNFPEHQHTAVLTNIRDFLLAGVKTRVQEEYAIFMKQQQSSQQEASDSGDLKKADDYRNEYMLSAIQKAYENKVFSFAAIGNNHLTAIKQGLDKKNIQSITMDEFYNNCSRDAV